MFCAGGGAKCSRAKQQDRYLTIDASPAASWSMFTVLRTASVLAE
jgi:hypothetical protein